MERHIMNETEKQQREQSKTLHKRAREAIKRNTGEAGYNKGCKPFEGHRYANLAWGFVRQLPFRRFEPRHRIQTVDGKPTDSCGKPVADESKAFEHNKPEWHYLCSALIEIGAVEGTMGKFRWSPTASADTQKAIESWLAEPMRAKPAARPKKPYVKPEPVAAE